jgi:hypothetical protein
MGQVASYNGLAAYPGYLLQQKLKHSCSRLCLLLCTAYALLPACYGKFFLQQLLIARICGAVPGKPASPGLYQTGAGRL